MSEDLDELAGFIADYRGAPADNIRVPCPRCLQERGDRENIRKNMSFAPATGKFMCWRCAWAGTLGEDGAQQSPRRCAIADVRKPVAIDASALPPMALPAEFVPLWCEPYVSALTYEEPLQYLFSRGVTLDVIREAGIGCAIEGYWSGRIIVPITAHGVCRGWSARAFVPMDRTYLYPRGMPRGEFLWREELITVPTEEPLYVFEGVFDVLAHWSNSVPVLGKPARGHIAKLAQAQRPIVVVFDGDAWGESLSLMLKLRMLNVVAGAVRLPDGVDPDEVSREWLREQAHRALEHAF